MHVCSDRDPGTLEVRVRALVGWRGGKGRVLRSARFPHAQVSQGAEGYKVTGPRSCR